MNAITRIAANTVVATGLAAAALTLGTGTAHAETPNGPNQFQVGPNVDPQGPVIGIPTPTPQPDPAPEEPELPIADKPESEPKPDPKPQHDGPGDITDTPDCTHGCGGGDDVPDDKAPAPQDDPTDDPADDAPLDQGCFTGCDLPEENAGPTVEKSVLTPSRIDAGQDSAAVLGNDQDETGLAYYAGLGLFSIAGAAGVALAARKLNRKTA